MNIGIYDARNRLSELVDKAKAGEEVVLTKHGVPVARIVPERDEQALLRQREEAWKRIDERREDIARRLGRRFTLEELLRDRDEGRP